MEELKSKDWRFYELLCSDFTKWWSQKEICDAIPEFVYIDDDRNHCTELGKSKDRLNENPIIDKIIVSKKHEFKIATQEEYKEERNYHIRKMKKQIAMIEAMDRKYEQNGQGKLFNNVLNELKPENEQFHETFVKQEQETPKLNGKLAFIDLVHKVAYIVNDVWEYTLNEETHIAYIGDKSILDIYEVITMDQLERPFYEDYRKETL